MRKFLVVMLVLAIAGGALAEDGEGTWSAWSGGATLGTTIDFYNNGSLTADDPGTIGISGLSDGSLAVRWDYVDGDWSVALPFVFEDGVAGVDGAKISYASGPIKVEIPISFKFAAVESSLPIKWSTAAVNATYTGEAATFKVGGTNLLTAPAVGAVGATFNLLDKKLDLIVSHGGAFATSFWRASAISIGSIRHPNNAPVNHDATAAQKLAASKDIAGWWEDVGANGLMIRYHISEQINAGVAFAGNAGKSMFTAYTPATTAADAVADRSNYNFVEQFLQPTFGFRFNDKDFGLDASAMVGIRSAFTFDKYYGFDYATDKNGAEIDKITYDGDNAGGVVMTVGAKFTVPLDFDLSVQGDFTMAIGGRDEDDVKPQIYYGAQVDFGMSVAEFPLAASVMFRGVGQDSPLYVYNGDGDLKVSTSALAKEYNPAYSTVNQLGVWLGFNRGLGGSRNGGFGDFGGAGQGIWIGGYLFLGDLFPLGADDFDEEAAVQFGAFLGYNGLEILEGLTLSADARIRSYVKVIDWFDNYDTESLKAPAARSTEKASLSLMEFSVSPSITWAIVENASLSVAYKIGSTNIADVDAKYDPFLGKVDGIIDISELSLTFKWAF